MNLRKDHSHNPAYQRELHGVSDRLGTAGASTSPSWELAGGSALLRFSQARVCSCCHWFCYSFARLLGSSHLRTCLKSQLSATDISAQAPMKGAAKCDNHCELQNSVNQWTFERALHSRDIPGSMPASVLTESSCKLLPSQGLVLLRAAAPGLEAAVRSVELLLPA